MKKYLLSLGVFLVSLSSMAQDVTISEFFGPKIDLYAQQFDGKPYIIAGFYSSGFEYDVTDQMMMKLQFMDGTDMLLPGYIVTSRTMVTSETLQGNHGDNRTDSRERNTYFVKFSLTDSEVEALAKGVSRIAFNTVPKVYRNDYKKDKIGHKLYEAFMKSKDLF